MWELPAARLNGGFVVFDSRDPRKLSINSLLNMTIDVIFKAVWRAAPTWRTGERNTALSPCSFGMRNLEPILQIGKPRLLALGNNFRIACYPAT